MILLRVVDFLVPHQTKLLGFCSLYIIPPFTSPKIVVLFLNHTVSSQSGIYVTFLVSSILIAKSL